MIFDRDESLAGVSGHSDGVSRVVLRADMHVHSNASRGAATALLGFLGVSECYSEPERVYAQARTRGMDLVCLTDHDTIDGAMELVDRGFDDVIVGEEITTRFPEDGCVLHVLVWGLTPEQHEVIEILGLRDDVYALAQWIEEERLAHSLAHPLYAQNGALSQWHIERCVLMFRAFEGINGAHARVLNKSINTYLDRLDEAGIAAIEDAHGLVSLYPDARGIARTGGSDDHGLLNIGRTWTEARVKARERDRASAFLEAVRRGKCIAKGSHGTTRVLAHQITRVGIACAAERSCGDRANLGLSADAWDVAKAVAASAGVALEERSKRKSHEMPVEMGGFGKFGWSILNRMLESAADHMPEMEIKYPDLHERLQTNRWTDGAALAMHERVGRCGEELFEKIVQTHAMDALMAMHMNDTDELVRSLQSCAGALVSQLPYCIAMYYQNRERRFAHLMSRSHADRPMRMCLVTDTLGDVNGVARFIENLATHAHAHDLDLTVLTCVDSETAARNEVFELPNVRNIVPALTLPMPGYGDLKLHLPSTVQLMHQIEMIEPDVIHMSTPGPVGLHGLMASKLFHVPLVATYHTDFPAYIERMWQHPLARGVAEQMMRAVHAPCDRVMVRSSAYVPLVEKLGVRTDRIVRIRPGVDVDLFDPAYRSQKHWNTLNRTCGCDLRESSIKVLYAGRVSVEKNLQLLEQVWERVRVMCTVRGIDAQLIVAGDGPYRQEMERRLAGSDAQFVGFISGEMLSRVYASSDVFVFPSVTDTLGQVVLEAQASGLPAVVTDQGGPSDVVSHNDTGYVLAAEVDVWVDHVFGLICDALVRQRMGTSARASMVSMSIERSLDGFWYEHDHVVRAQRRADELRWNIRDTDAQTQEDSVTA
ncbi:MAG: glycosyltransferase [Phycisphaeraceae bacterium]|nr:glycosyltransferase [Phycisphaerales bacterium]MCB9859859.1 glycosyltransferase [Phycisphaeraceae bacterium]